VALTLILLLAAIALFGSSGLAGLFLGHRSSVGQRTATGMMVAGAALGLFAVARALMEGESVAVDIPWFLPWGSFRLKADGLAQFFLAPVFLLPALGSVYGLGYWEAAEHPGSARTLQFFYGILAASMAIVVLAQDGVLFLIAWEVMALAAYFLATADTADPAACKSGWMYLIGAHVGAVFLIAMFALLYRANGSFALVELRPENVLPKIVTGLFLLGLVGFGLKVGLMPLHLFLPGAPASSPCHVSALLSGVVYKVGIYGLIRISGLLPVAPAWWGGLLLFIGAGSAVLGVTFALAQSDLKRALAYSSFENIGIISMGLGLALLGRTFARADWILLGLGGALFHSWNHALFKPLLFLGAGAIERGVHSTDINKLGGLAKSLPRSATLFMFGALAICGLPPLNGFASELMIYLGLFRTTGFSGTGSGTWPLAALAVPCLSLTGALAVACFINLSGTMFLGQRRVSSLPERASDPPRVMTHPMILIAVLCALIGLAPGVVLPAIDHGVRAWSSVEPLRGVSLGGLFPASWISAAGGALLTLVSLGMAICVRAVKNRPVQTAGTWDCGYLRPTPRMEYTGSSFGHSLREIFRWALWPRVHRPQIDGLFPKTTHLKTHVQDPVLDRLTLPGAQFLGRFFAWLRLLQQGHLQIYMLYFFVVTVLLLLWGRSSR
jgi:hydrogenase-4 component B